MELIKQIKLNVCCMCFQDLLHQHIVNGFIVHQKDYLALLVQASAATSRPYEPDGRLRPVFIRALRCPRSLYAAA